MSKIASLFNGKIYFLFHHGYSLDGTSFESLYMNSSCPNNPKVSSWADSKDISWMRGPFEAGNGLIFVDSELPKRLLHGCKSFGMM
jgi:hypothetical protein